MSRKGRYACFAQRRRERKVFFQHGCLGDTGAQRKERILRFISRSTCPDFSGDAESAKFFFNTEFAEALGHREKRGLQFYFAQRTQRTQLFFQHRVRGDTEVISS